MAQLRLLGKGGTPDKLFELGEMATLGRHPSQDVQILDRVVSKSHARIVRRNGRHHLADLGSRNGTFHNGKRLQRTVELQQGDRIKMGNAVLVFEDSLGQDKTLLGKVNIGSTTTESNIQGRVAGADNLRFAPEADIRDEQALRRDYEKLRISMELSQELGLERELDRLQEKILDKAIELFNADRAVMLLVDEQTGQFVPQLVKTKDPEIDAEGINISSTVLKTVLAEKAGVLSTDAVMDERFASAQSIILSGIRSTMSVPMLTADKLLGIIYLDSLISTGAFTEKDLQLLTGFANQAATAIETNRLLRQLEKEALARDRLGRLLSPNLVDQVVSGRLEVKQGGELRNATVLFSDIRGFTSMSEKTPAQEVLSLLNAYFEVMVDIIFKYEGTLDKFVGDEVMAVWGAPLAQDACELRAVLTALEMRAALKEFNKVMTSDGFPALEIGIGINSGEMVCGYMGSSKTMDYTVIGDAVNLGARLCSAAKPRQILISTSTYEAVKDKIPVEEELSLKVKGKSGMIPVFAVGDIQPG